MNLKTLIHMNLVLGMTLFALAGSCGVALGMDSAIQSEKQDPVQQLNNINEKIKNFKKNMERFIELQDKYPIFLCAINNTEEETQVMLKDCTKISKDAGEKIKKTTDKNPLCFFYQTYQKEQTLLHQKMYKRLFLTGATCTLGLGIGTLNAVLKSNTCAQKTLGALTTLAGIGSLYCSIRSQQKIYPFPHGIRNRGKAKIDWLKGRRDVFSVKNSREWPTDEEINELATITHQRELDKTFDLITDLHNKTSDTTKMIDSLRVSCKQNDPILLTIKEINNFVNDFYAIHTGSLSSQLYSRLNNYKFCIIVS